MKTAESRAMNAISQIRKGTYEDWVKVIQQEINEHAKQCLQQAVERITMRMQYLNDSENPITQVRVAGLKSSIELIRQLLKELE